MNFFQLLDRSNRWIKSNLRLPCRSLAFVAVMVFVGGCSSLPQFGNDINLASSTNPPDEFRRGNITDKESAEACIAIAENFEESGHLFAAVTQYERARKQDPKRIEYARRLAVLYARLGRQADARREFKHAIDESPKDIDLKNDYAYFLTTSGDATAGEKILREILDKAPDHARANVNLGINLTYQDRLPEAHDVFARAIGSTSAHHNIGVILSKRGKQTEAEAAFQLAQTNP